MKPTDNPFEKLSHMELIWLMGILKDACHERLEKNLVTQAIEERVHAQRGPLKGRVDPRAELKEWEPRYRKFLEVATEAHDLVRMAEAEEFKELLAAQMRRTRKTAARQR